MAISLHAWLFKQIVSLIYYVLQSTMYKGVSKRTSPPPPHLFIYNIGIYTGLR